MNEIIRKKLNLLVHLANIDGDFAETEQSVLTSMLETAGEETAKIPNDPGEINFNEFTSSKIDKPDILYWALRLIKADGIIHPDESAYCKALAMKLNFKPEVVDFFVNNELGDPKDFKKKSLPFSSKSA